MDQCDTVRRTPKPCPGSINTPGHLRNPAPSTESMAQSEMFLTSRQNLSYTHAHSHNDEEENKMKTGEPATKRSWNTAATGTSDPMELFNRVFDLAEALDGNTINDAKRLVYQKYIIFRSDEATIALDSLSASTNPDDKAKLLDFLATPGVLQTMLFNNLGAGRVRNWADALNDKGRQAVADANRARGNIALVKLGITDVKAWINEGATPQVTNFQPGII